MAYSPVKQADADLPAAIYHNLTVGATPSPRLADIPQTSLSLSFDDAHDAAEDASSLRVQQPGSKVTKFLSSLTSSSQHSNSYDLVEEDDYEVVEQITPTLERHTKDIMATVAPVRSAEPVHHDPPMRTASVSRQLPMNHPIPDLQSIQGAYIKNVEHLEETAAQLSLTSGIEAEIQRIKDEQRQRERAASGSARSISARSGPHRRTSNRSISSPMPGAPSSANIEQIFPSPYIASPIDVMTSPRSMQSDKGRKQSENIAPPLPEPEFEGRPLDFEFDTQPLRASFDLDPRPVRSESIAHDTQNERPTTSGSGDTYQQARTLFTDFDGVHYAPDRMGGHSRRISLNRPPRARDSRAFREPQPGEQMIYYPAPVPVMLNLPTRLSRMNWSEHEKKRLQVLANMPDEHRKSAAWLAGEDKLPAATQRHSVLPPQLRASAFFDQGSTNADIQLKNGSAVATLDSILDAAAHAPVSAFTDHPIAGHLGDDFYGTSEPPSRKSMQLTSPQKAKRKSSLSNLLRPRRSSGNLVESMARESRVPSMMLSSRDDGHSDHDVLEDEVDKSIAPDADELPDNVDEHELEKDEDHDSEAEIANMRPGFSTAPTTLLAELQMRKAQQRKRNRTAADAFPNGMHSTLLELDTVTQLQQKARKQKHVKLAWEDTDLVDKENFGDEDVPLGVLFPEKEQQSKINMNRPLGLMEKKELEENEPLSQRRARLRGEPLQPPVPARSPGISQQGDAPPTPMLELPNLGDASEEDDQEGETLAQRRQRMKDKKAQGSSASFARHLSSELGLKVEPNGENGSPSLSGSKTPEMEETLGQRRKRLQAENTRNGDQDAAPAAILRTKKSLADILQANPIGYVNPNKGKTAYSAMRDQERIREREAQYLAAQQADRQQSYTALNHFGNGNHNGLLQSSLGGYQGVTGYQQPLSAMSGINLPVTYGGQNMQTSFGYPHINTFATQASTMNPVLGTMNMQTRLPYQQPMGQPYGYPSAMDLTGMGPPLDSKQRARIEGWRQGIM